MACAFIYRRVSLNELCDEVVQSDAIRSLMKKISVTETLNFSPAWVGAADIDHVLVKLDGGTCLESKKIRYAKGHAKYPLPRTDTDEKFLACLQYGQSSLDSQALLDKLWALESQQQINNLWI